MRLVPSFYATPRGELLRWTFPSVEREYLENILRKKKKRELKSPHRDYALLNVGSIRNRWLAVTALIFGPVSSDHQGRWDAVNNAGFSGFPEGVIS